MSTDSRQAADMAGESVYPGQAIELHITGIDGVEDLIVTQSIDKDNLRRLLECLAHEDCIHSWKNFGPDGTLDELLQWENERRPTRLFFFHLKCNGKLRMIAASAVAERLTGDSPHPGFCVLGRCYIMPEFREMGFYRSILHYRLEYCRAQFGSRLNAIHIGSVSERISRVITNHRLASWSNFVHLGEEELRVAGKIRTVGAYMLLLPEYVRQIRSSLDGAHAPSCVLELRDVFAGIASGSIRNLGVLAKKKFEDACACGWFDEHSPHEIEQLLAFCRSIPLVGM